MKCNKDDLLLYAVTDRRWSNGRTLYEQVEEALKGGVTFIQLREKNMEETDLLEEAKAIKELCAKYDVPFIINDNVAITQAVDADGVHVGQNDMKAGDVRMKLGKDKIIGVSVRSVEQAVRSEQQGADYLGVGAAFHTGSKTDAKVVSHDVLRDICNAVQIPVIAIGGIDSENVLELSGSGICGVAVISGIFGKKDIRKAAEELRKLTEKMVKAE